MASGTSVPEHIQANAAALADRLMADPAQLPALDGPTPMAIVEQVVERLKAEADRHWAIDPRRSLEFADLIIAIGTRRDLPLTIALGKMTRGDSLKLLGQTTEAWEALDQAGQMYRALGDDYGWARTRIGRLHLGLMLNCVPEAFADAEQARIIFQRHGDPERLIRLDWVSAFVYNSLGEPRRALALFQSTLATAEALGPAGQSYIGGLYLNIGSTYEALGELQQALDYYQRARDLFAANGDLLHLATAEANIGLVAQAQGHYRRALPLLTAALERAADHSPHEATQIKWHLLQCYLSLGRHAEARDLARQIVADNRAFNDAFEVGRTLVYLATTEAELAAFDAARAALDEAEGIFATLNAAPWSATVWLRRGRLLLRLGQAAEAADEARRAAEVFDANGRQGDAAAAALLAGLAALALGELATARHQGARALSNARRYHVPALRYSAHLLLGQAAEAAQAGPRALRHYQAAAATTERVQRGLTLTLRPGFLEDNAEALRRLIALHLRDGRAAPALAALEQAKGQVLLGYLTNRDALRWDQADPRSRALLDELERLRGEHQWFYRLAHAAPTPGDHPSPVPPAQALAEVAARERRMRSITEQLYVHTPGGEAAHPATGVPLDEIQHALDDATLLIEYYDDGEQVWAFLLSRQGLRAQPLPLSMPEALRLLAQVQLNLAAALRTGPKSPGLHPLALQAQRLLQRLHAGLIAPLALPPGAWQRLVIVPYGALHYLPVHLLFDGARYLIEQAEVVVLPAAVLAARPGPRRAPGARVLAHSWDGRLPHTAAEAEMVQALLGGEVHAEQAATRARLQAAPRQVLHMATHGHYRLDQPDLSYLHLADGQLYTDDLVQEDLSYELVTLSACETGRAHAAGGELIGLGRGFLYAGAGALLLSLWPVADDASLDLMRRIYQGLRAGQSKAAAVRDAQRALLAADTPPHPAFWGAFQLIGDARPLTA